MNRFFVYIIIFCSAALSAQATVDTLKPEIEISGECAYYTISITENNFGNPGDEPRQVDAGIKRVPFLDSESENFKPLIIDQSFRDDTANYDFNIYLEVDDKFKPAKAIFVVIDDAEPPNILFDSITYFPQYIAFSSAEYDFGNVRLNTEKSFKINGLNRTNFDFYVDSVYFTVGDYFYSDFNNAGYYLRANRFLEFDISYKPENDILNTEIRDFDTLIIKTECLEYRFPVSGAGVMPQIVVQDHNFDWHFKGDLICKMPLMFPDYDEGLLIHNPGSDTLRIFDYYHFNENSPVKLEKPSNPPIPELKIAPGETAEVFRLCFEPTEQGEYFNRIYFESNAEGPDSVSNAYAISFINGPYFEDYNFPKLKVGKNTTGSLKFMNNGDVPVAVEGFYLEDADKGFSIIEEDIFPPIPSNGYIIVYPEDYEDPNVVKSIEIPVSFTPQKEHESNTKIRAIFSDDVRNDTSYVYNYLRGYGSIPKIKTNDYTFNPDVMINTMHPDTAVISIENTSTSGKLHIKNMEIVDYLSEEQHFIILDELPSDIYIDERSEFNIRVLFKPVSKGEHLLTLRVFHDAGVYEIPQIKENIISIRGSGYKNLSIPTEVNFPEIPHCNSDVKYVSITNLSPVDTLFIDNIEITENENNVFTTEINKLAVLPDRTDSIEINFTPGNSIEVYHYAYLKLHNEGDIHNINLTGRSRLTEVIVSVDTLRNISPGVKTQVYEGTDISDDFRINVFSGNWEEALIDEIELKLIYRHNSLRFSDVINPGDFPIESMNYDKMMLDDSLSELSVHIKLQDYINSDGILFRPVFEILLGKKLKIYSEMKDISFGGMESCLKINNRKGYILLRGCNIEIRRVITNMYNYEELKILPNPAGHENVELTYTIGLRNHTKVEILNSSGQTIDVITNGVQKAGRYSVLIDAGKYPSGIYNVRISSGPFKDSEKMIIIK